MRLSSLDTMASAQFTIPQSIQQTEFCFFFPFQCDVKGKPFTWMFSPLHLSIGSLHSIALGIKFFILFFWICHETFLLFSALVVLRKSCKPSWPKQASPPPKKKYKEPQVPFRLDPMTLCNGQRRRCIVWECGLMRHLTFAHFGFFSKERKGYRDETDKNKRNARREKSKRKKEKVRLLASTWSLCNNLKTCDFKNVQCK